MPRKTHPESLSMAVGGAIEAMPWIEPSDAGLVKLAKSYAAAIDEALDIGGQDAVKGLYLGPHMLGALRELGGTPGSRKELEVVENVKGKLATLRALRGGKNEAAEQAG